MPDKLPIFMTRPSRFRTLLLVAIAGILFAQCNGETESSSATPSSNTSSEQAAVKPRPVDPNAVVAPDFELKDLNGATVSLSQFRGHVVLVDFWATWCGPCRRTIPDLKDLYQTLNKDGFDILGVALERRGLENLTAYVKTNAIPYPVLVGTGEMVGKYGNIRSIPTAFLIGRDGTIRNRFIGVQPRHVLESAIRSLLAEPSA